MGFAIQSPIRPLARGGLGALGSFYAELSLNWKPDDCNWCDFAKPERKKPPNMRIKDGFLHFIAAEEQWEETFPNIVL